VLLARSRRFAGGNRRRSPGKRPASLDKWTWSCAFPRDFLGRCAGFFPRGLSVFQDTTMHPYRSHTCAALRKSDVGGNVRLSGWVHRVRDHGGVLFIDLRDHYGITQVVADPDSPAFKKAETVRGEWVSRVDGEVKARADDAVNTKLPTGEVEIFAQEIEVLGAAKELPLPVFGEPEYPED